MSRKHAVEYIDHLLEGETYRDLVELSSAICSSPQFASRAPEYGLPTFAFLFVETLLWFAQAMRSGVWTYYEATPIPRQRAMAAGLRAHGPEGFADLYERGVTEWRDEEKIGAVEDRMEANEAAANEWLRQLAREHRDALLVIM